MQTKIEAIQFFKYKLHNTPFQEDMVNLDNDMVS